MAAEQSSDIVTNDLEEKVLRLRQGKALRVIDLFSGCGGMSLGLKRAGFHFVGEIEINQQAINTYVNNIFKDADDATRKLQGTPRDITTFTPEMFLREVLKKESPDNLVDVLVGGPPCQAFSRIGRAKLRAVRQNPDAYRDDKRSTLYLHYLAYVDFFRPLAVIMENVPDIMNYGGKNIAEEIAISLKNIGYRCHYTILNTAHYGVPQLRQRFYLIAILDTLQVEPCFPEPTHFIQVPSGYESAHMSAISTIERTSSSNTRYIDPPTGTDSLPYAVTTYEALHDLPPIKGHLEGTIKRGPRKLDTLTHYLHGANQSAYAHDMRNWPGFESSCGVWDHMIRFLPRDHIIFQQMKHDDQYPQAHKIAKNLFHDKLQELQDLSGIEISVDSDIYQHLLKQTVPPYDPEKFPNKWWKLNPNQPSRTLTAHIGKDTYSHIHYDSDQARVISVREAARLQSFPDGFRFSGAMNAAYTQIGNAVAPLQAYALGKHVKQLLQKATTNNYELTVV